MPERIRCPICSLNVRNDEDTGLEQPAGDAHVSAPRERTAGELVDGGFASMEASGDNGHYVCFKCGFELSQHDVRVFRALTRQFGEDVAIGHFRSKQEEAGHESDS